MKKFSLILLSFIVMFSSLLFVGCDGNKPSGNEYEQQGFVAVKSINYETVAEHSTEFQSYYSITFTNNIEISAEEFANLDAFSLPHSYSNSFNIYDKKDVPNSNISLIKFYSSNYNKYYTAEVTKIDINYVYVKIISNNQIEVIFNNQHKLILTQWFEINYFNN